MLVDRTAGSTQTVGLQRMGICGSQVAPPRRVKVAGLRTGGWRSSAVVAGAASVTHRCAEILPALPIYLMQDLQAKPSMWPAGSSDLRLAPRPFYLYDLRAPLKSLQLRCCQRQDILAFTRCSQASLNTHPRLIHDVLNASTLAISRRCHCWLWVAVTAVRLTICAHRHHRHRSHHCCCGVCSRI